MTSPWPYTGKAVPQSKPMTSSAAPQPPARVVSELVPISPMSRNDGTQAGKARAQTTEQGFKTKPTNGGTPKRLWPTAVDSADRQDETAAATTPSRIKANKQSSQATSAKQQKPTVQQRKTVSKHEGKTTERKTLTFEPTSNDEHLRASEEQAKQDRWIVSDEKKGGVQMAKRLLSAVANASMVFGSTVMLKGLLLPKLTVHMPNIVYNVKKLLLITHATATRIVEQVAGHAGNYPKFALVYALTLFAASSLRLSGELHLFARLVMQACNAILGLHGISTDALRLTRTNDDEHENARVDEHENACEVLETSEEDEPEAEPDEPDATATDTDDADGSEDESASYKDFKTFWETRP